MACRYSGVNHHPPEDKEISTNAKSDQDALQPKFDTIHLCRGNDEEEDKADKKATSPK